MNEGSICCSCLQGWSGEKQIECRCARLRLKGGEWLPLQLRANCFEGARRQHAQHAQAPRDVGLRRS
jgi:hypothetical protein